MRASVSCPAGYFARAGPRWCGGWRRATFEDCMAKSKTKTKIATHSAARKISKGKSRTRSTPASSKLAARPDTKHARIIAMLRAPAGTTIAAIMTATECSSTRFGAFLLVSSARSSVSIWFPNRLIKVGSTASRMEKLRPPLRIAQSVPRDTMVQKRRSGRASTKASIGDEIAHLRGLDLKGLRSRWQSVFQRLPPDHLPRHLLFAIIAYRIQADRLGDLDHETKHVLDQTDAKKTSVTMSARLVSFDQKRTELTPGTVLVREWDRHSQRVMVVADGFAWNGQTYDSLSKVAFAITGTKWNGPRFFGLRDNEDQPAAEARS
jgi:Protein of unknown function (DUF2924)